VSAPRNALERPSGACLTCAPPLGTRSWIRATDGYRTCDMCLDKLRGQLADIATRYAKLNPRPGVTGDGERGAPGFGSTAPASVHIIALMDPRSSSEAHVWVGGDGRVHKESERPPLSVYGVLETEARDVAELRRIDNVSWSSVYELTKWLDLHLDWITRQDTVADFAGNVRALVSQLRPLTGDPRQKPFSRCPNTIDSGEHTRTCDGPLYPPKAISSIITCRVCGRDWERGKGEWEKLGLLLKTA
jgi:hypothetical protein